MFHHTELQFRELEGRGGPTCYIILHHTGKIKHQTVEDVHREDLKAGKAGIGFHYYIDKNGDVYEGRPLYAEGAHSYGHNYESIGVCFEGDFNKEEMSERQMNGSIMLLSLLSLAYEDAFLGMHREFNKGTQCPGVKFPFEAIRDKVETCKCYLRFLFGEPRCEDFYPDYEWRHFADHLGADEEEEFRHNAPNIIGTRNFNYFDIIDLFGNIGYHFIDWRNE